MNNKTRIEKKLNTISVQKDLGNYLKILISEKNFFSLMN